MKSMNWAIFTVVLGASYAQAQALESFGGPCPLGMILTFKSISMVPACVGTPIRGIPGADGITSKLSGGVAGLGQAAAGVAAGTLERAVTGAGSNKSDGGQNVPMSSGVQQQAQDYVVR